VQKHSFRHRENRVILTSMHNFAMKLTGDHNKSFVCSKPSTPSCQQVHAQSRQRLP
jgi:hypothetical protein